MSGSTLVVGIDIGGTKIAITLAELNLQQANQTKILESVRIAGGSISSPEVAYREMIDTIEQLLVRQNAHKSQLRAIGLGAPGSINLETGVMASSPNMPLWNQINLASPLVEAFNCQVFVENDANGGVLAEAIFGSARGFQNVIYLTMSTGIGGGVISSGRLLHGRVGLAGELGHLTLNPQGPRCGCGLKGCFEVYCGGKNVELALKKQAQAGDQSILSWPMVHGDVTQLGVPALLDALKQQIPSAQTIWQEYIHHLAHGVGLCLTAFNPDVIVFGTIAHHAGSLFFDPLEKEILNYTWPEMRQACQFKTSDLGLKIGELSGIATAIYHLLGHLPE